MTDEGGVRADLATELAHFIFPAFSRTLAPVIVAVLFAVSFIASLSPGVLPEAAWALIALVCALAGAGVAVHRANVIQLKLNVLDVALFALWVWAVFSPIWSVQPFTSVLFAAPLTLAPLAYLALRLNEKAAHAFPVLVFAAGGMLGVGAIVQVVIGQGTFFAQAQWPLASPNALALLLGVGLCAGLSLEARCARTYQILTRALLCAIAMGVVCTASRTGMMGVLCLSVLWAMFDRATRKPILLATFAAALAAAVLSFSVPDSTVNTAARFQIITEDHAEHLTTRPQIWTTTLELIREAPVIGSGLGTFAARYQAVQAPDENSTGLKAHNDFLQTALELGGVGAALLLAICIIGIWHSVRILRTGQADLFSVTALALIGGFALIDYPLQIMPVLLLIGGLLARMHTTSPSLFSPFALQPKIVFLPFVLASALIAAFLGAHLLTQQAVRVSDQNLAQAQRYLNVAALFDLGLNPERPRTQAMMLLYALDPLTVPKDVREKTVQQIDTSFDRARKLATLDATTDLYQATANMVLFRDYNVYLAQALAKNPRLIAARYHLADFYARAGRKVQAVALLETGLVYSYPPVEIYTWFPRVADLAQAVGRADLAARAQAHIRDKVRIRDAPKHAE